MKNAGRRSCCGQAITELVACLIGICFIVLGMLFVSTAGSKGVRNMLEARKEVEKSVRNSTGTSEARSISIWNNIKENQGDGLYFTADDFPSYGDSGNSNLYKEQLISTAKDFDIPALAANRKTDNYIPFSAVESGSFFVRAADLREGKADQADPLEDKHLQDLKRAMGRFGMGTKVTIKDKLYLPSLQNENKGSF